MSHQSVTLAAPLTGAVDPKAVVPPAVTTPTTHGAAVHSTEVVAPAVSETPILGKFKDHAALEAAYTELEKKVGKPAEAPKTPETPKVETPVAPSDADKAYETTISAEFSKAAGGEQQLGEVVKWAGANLPKASQDAYNAALDTKNPMVAAMAFNAILAQYQMENGIEPNLVQGEVIPGALGVKPFADRAEHTAAINDPRYEKSEAYRKEVERRAMVTRH